MVFECFLMILVILDSNHSISFKLLSFVLPKLFLTDLTRAHTSLPLSPFHPSIRSPSAPFWELSVLGDFCLPTASVRTAGNAYAWSLKSAMGRWRRTLESEMQISEMMKIWIHRLPHLIPDLITPCYQLVAYLLRAEATASLPAMEDLSWSYLVE